MIDRSPSTSRTRGQTRFDSSSWITLSIVIGIFLATLGVAVASYNVPMDGWFIDRGAWGRYTNLLYAEPFFPKNDTSTLKQGDILLAVEGVSFEQLEAHAASLQPQRPDNWKLGETVHYTVLRNGREFDATATLIRPLLFSTYRPWVLITNPILLTFPIFLSICVLVFALRPRERAAQLLLLFGFSFFNENFISWDVVPPGVADLFSTATYWPKLILGNMLWSIIIVPLLVHLFLTFPIEKSIFRRYPRLTLFLLYGFFAAASAGFVIWNISGHYLSGTTFISVLTAPSVLLIASSLVHSFITVKDPVARMQVRWVALGGLVGIVGPITFWTLAGGLSSTSPLWQGLLFLVMSLAFPLSLGVAILRYRLWDIDLIIRRTLQYTLLTGLLALVYFLSVVLLQQVFSEQSQFSIVLSTLATAALFSPLRKRIQNTIDRRFYRRRYDAERIIAAFAVQMRDQVELEKLSAALLATVEETMQPEHASLWMRDS